MGRSNYDVRLSRPLALKSGRVVRSLADGVELMGELPEFPNLRPAWQMACEAILRAAKAERTAADIEAATRELELALRWDRTLHAIQLSRQAEYSAPLASAI